MPEDQSGMAPLCTGGIDQEGVSEQEAYQECVDQDGVDSSLPETPPEKKPLSETPTPDGIDDPDKVKVIRGRKGLNGFIDWD